MKRILVVRPDRIGDVVLVTPLIRSLRESFPDAYIGAMVRSATRAVLEGNPRLDAIITDDYDGVDKGVGVFWRKAAEIRRHAFDTGLLVFPTQRSAYLLFAAGIPRRIGVGHILYEVLTFMQSIGSRKFVPLRHEADYALDFARKLQATRLLLEPEIFLSGEEKQWAPSELKRLGARHPIILLHPQSGRSAPNWKIERYCELADALLQEGFSVIVTGSAEDVPRNLPLAAKKGIIDCTGRYSLRELICLISAIDLCISSSTGPMHIAAALGIQTISMFCPLPACSPTLWGPLGSSSEVLVAPDNYCSKICPGDPHICDFEGGIEVETVFRRVMEVLERKNPPRG
jgi:lipopolysaccharide heptosyltransferase II